MAHGDPSKNTGKHYGDKAKVEKTQVGNNYYVRGPGGKVLGEYETRKEAENKASKINKTRMNRKS